MYYNYFNRFYDHIAKQNIFQGTDDDGASKSSEQASRTKKRGKHTKKKGEKKSGLGDPESTAVCCKLFCNIISKL